ncbi:cytochrome b [Ralstonia pickettii]|uniref:cytochrome b n=1 Tax=Ralstonia pickettii TaxID=329 RepID=UPI000818C868|nr:cytochrome b [Ralstonia pickettii]OCS47446.1 cytochrome B [Ralstonia pickettii]
MYSEQKYSPAIRSLHWLVFLAALVAVVTIDIHDLFPKGSAMRGALFTIHQTAGLSVLALMVLRLFARLGTEQPAALPGPKLLERAARAMHLVLYVLMLCMPILGAMALAWDGKAIQPFGLAWTAPLAPDKALADLVKEVHESGATLVYIFVGLHAVAALWHEVVLKDRLLRRMI